MIFRHIRPCGGHSSDMHLEWIANLRKFSFHAIKGQVLAPKWLNFQSILYHSNIFHHLWRLLRIILRLRGCPKPDGPTTRIKTETIHWLVLRQTRVVRVLIVYVRSSRLNDDCKFRNALAHCTETVSTGKAYPCATGDTICMHALEYAWRSFFSHVLHASIKCQMPSNGPMSEWVQCKKY